MMNFMTELLLEAETAGSPVAVGCNQWTRPSRQTWVAIQSGADSTVYAVTESICWRCPFSIDKVISIDVYLLEEIGALVIFDKCIAGICRAQGWQNEIRGWKRAAFAGKPSLT